MLPDAAVKDRIAKLCVGLAADCDPPGSEAAVEKMFASHLPGAGSLPMGAFVTPDLQWVGGFSGFKSAEEFVAALEQAEKSPAMNAQPEDAKKLDGLAAQATKAVEKSQWKDALAAGKAAAAISGRAPSRAKIAEAVAKARAWADGEMTKHLEAVKSGGDRTAFRVAMKKVSAAFAGEPESKEADAGLKAIEKLSVIEALADAPQTAAREKAVKDFAGTRWTALFEKTEAKPAEKPADGK